MKKFRIVSVILAVILMCSLFAACGKKESALHDVGGGTGYADNTGNNSTPATSEKSGSALEITNVTLGQKIIYYVKYSIETLDFDSSILSINALVSELGGYIQNSNIAGKARSSGAYTQPRTASYTLRIPTERLNDFFDAVGSVGSVRSESLTTEDVTLQYTDIEARINSLKVQESRIIDILSKADTLQYVLELESKLSDVRYQIENYTSKLNRYDSLIMYSTVTLSLTEVYELSVTNKIPQTFGEKLAERFNKSVNRVWNAMTAFALWFLGNIVEIAIFTGLIALAVFLILRLNKKAAQRKPNFSSENKDRK